MKALKFVTPILFLFAIMCFTTSAQEQKNDQVFYVVEDMPEYPGGEEALRNDLSKAVKYPDEAKKKGISGKVYITFIVNESGKIEDPKIVRGVDPVLDKEALRAIQTLKTWEPGKQKGKAVKVSYTVPINFALDGAKNNTDSEVQKTMSDEKLVFKIVEEMPEFPGGEEALKKYISNSVKYPEDAKKEGIKGKVFVSFTVSQDGTVADSKIARGVHPSIDKEALRIINNLPIWKPGKQRGQNVNVQYTVPINFELEAKQ